ncbi:MAG: Uma2 family endonuclease [Acidimicrobiales bacterium]
MRTVVLGPPPPDVERMIERRRALGLDTHDELWDGDYHMGPAANAWHGYLDNEIAMTVGPLARQAGLFGTGPFNLGESNNFRVPDRGLHRTVPSGAWISTAAMVVEILSPDDETWEKFDHYRDHGVDELMIVDPEQGTITIFVLTPTGYVDAASSALLGVSAVDLISRVDWPSAR